MTWENVTEQRIADKKDVEARLKQWELVDKFRAADEETAKRLDDFLNSGSSVLDEFDRYNIMYIVYTAKEPFKSLFLKSLDMYRLGDVALKGMPFYTHNGNKDKSPFATKETVNLNAETSFYYSDKGPYNGFFHECGHAIDYQLGKHTAFSREYKQKSNYKVMCRDVYANVEKELRMYFKENPLLDKKQEKIVAEKIMNYVRNCGRNLNSLKKDEKEIFDVVDERMHKKLKAKGEYIAYSPYVGKMKAYIHAGISDAYSGVTDNLIAGDKTHANYWFSDKPPYKRTAKQETEMWAHYFSFGITGTDEAIEHMRTEFLQRTMKRYDKMAKKMLEKKIKKDKGRY